MMEVQAALATLISQARDSEGVMREYVTMPCDSLRQRLETTIVRLSAATKEAELALAAEPPVKIVAENMARCDAGVRARRMMELRVVWGLIRHLDAAGFNAVQVDNGEELIDTDTDEQVMEHVFSVDESRVYFRDGNNQRRMVYIVLGNDGWDAISDYSDDRGPFVAAMGAFDSEKVAGLK